MRPYCKHCSQEITWEGFDLEQDEWVCGVCIRTRRFERERIVALLDEWLQDDEVGKRYCYECGSWHEFRPALLSLIGGN